MNDALIPEIIRKRLSSEDINPNRVNISLSQNIDRRINNYNQSYSQTNTEINNTTTNTYQGKGFFAFIFSVLTLPFTLLISSCNYLFKKYDIKNVFETEKMKMAKSKWVTKYIKSTNDVYNFDEIF